MIIHSSISAIQRVKVPQAADWALSHGINSLTTTQVAEILGTTANQVSPRLASAIKRGEWIAPARGLWIPVPPEYRNWGGPPAVEFIDALMRYKGVEYYLGWLSAAAIHGSAHHAPQVTQIATPQSIRNRKIGRVRLRFYARSNMGKLPTVSRTVRYNTIRVSTPEVTALDLCSDIELAGGISNLATVIAGLAEESSSSIDRIASLSGYYSPAATRRLGWLLEHYTDVGKLDDLAAAASRSAPTPSLLDSLSPMRGSLDKRWMIRINTEVEIED
ncbi:MAG: type IV toxin-antitoxin system AbiEi family antitoxin [Coriobacteriales bacterium]|nr:type IV toxin-antitoxin system AbiEi family antitoxin [Coriobacteriales bacterium]